MGAPDDRIGAAMGAGIRGYDEGMQEARVVPVPFEAPPKRSMTQREYDNAMQAAPFFKGASGGGLSGNGLSFEERKALIEAATEGRLKVAGAIQGPTTERTEKVINSRHGLQNKEFTFKEGENEKNRQLRLDLEALRQTNKKELSEYNKSFSGFNAQQKTLYGVWKGANDQLTALMSKDVAVYRTDEWREQVIETKAAIAAAKAALDRSLAANPPAAKTGNWGGKKTSTTVPTNPAKGAEAPPADPALPPRKRLVKIKTKAGIVPRNLTDAEIKQLDAKKAEYTIEE
jgi:hypothetical protein